MIVEERMRTYINSLDMGNTPFLEELEKELDKQIRQMESTHPGYDEYLSLIHI